MRHSQNRRSRSRSRKGPNPLTRSYESNGPDVKVRGTASTVAERYMTLARDAQSSGDIVAAENYLQHAEHYNRIVMAAQAQFQPSPSQYRDGPDEGAYDDDRQSNGGSRDRFDYPENGPGGEGDNDEPFESGEDDEDRGYNPRQARDPRDQNRPDMREQPRQDNRPRHDTRDMPRRDTRNDNRNDSRNEGNRPDYRDNQRGPRPPYVRRDRPEQDTRNSYPDRNGRGDRPERQDAGFNGERYDRYERNGQSERGDRADRGERSSQSGRGDFTDRGEGDAHYDPQIPGVVPAPQESSPPQGGSAPEPLPENAAPAAAEASPPRRRRKPRAESGERNGSDEVAEAASPEGTPDGAAALAAFPD